MYLSTQNVQLFGTVKSECKILEYKWHINFKLNCVETSG